MDRGVHVPEVPLVGGDLAVGVEVTGPQEELQLFFAEVLVHQSQSGDVESQIPGGVPGIFPFFRHGNNVRADHVSPAVVAEGALMGFVRLDAVFFEPVADVIEEELLGPEHAGQGLPHDIGGVGINRGRNDGGIELIGFLAPGLEDGFEGRPEKPA